MREQIADYLAQGMKQSEVANILGCEASVISELINHDESFKELFREKAKQYVSQRINTKYDDLEEKTLNQLKEAIAMAPEVSDLVRILEAIARIKTVNKVQNLGTYTNPTVGIVINMPAGMAPNIQTDSNNRIITIGGKSMEAMPVAQVKDMFANMDMKNAKRIEDNRPIAEELKFARSA
jgi:predicted transcriptional regulator